MRLFFALCLPPGLAAQLAGLAEVLPGGHALGEEDLHLTLHFLGELDEPRAEEAAWAAEALQAGPVWLRLQGLGSYGARGRLSLHAVVAPEPGLLGLQDRLGSRLAGAGLILPRRRFRPHITLARGLRGGPALDRIVAANIGLSPPPVAARSFGLFRSWLHADGARYERLQDYPLVLPLS
ncbi:RNA 2',3'-cyclic phosphodiesterase [Frigidibacter sp. MR17.14]|uniref:RNA 2',3'-cyclic phosphodiesterase n=1 Tax=Frigidibacter sp. MR17.14 TaxID=3126509 RepID=UPI003012A148